MGVALRERVLETTEYTENTEKRCAQDCQCIGQGGILRQARLSNDCPTVSNSDTATCVAVHSEPTEFQKITDSHKNARQSCVLRI